MIDHAPVAENEARGSADAARRLDRASPGAPTHAEVVAAFWAFDDAVCAPDGADANADVVVDAIGESLVVFRRVLMAYVCGQRGSHDIVHDHCGMPKHMLCSTCRLRPAETPGWTWDATARTWRAPT